MNINLEECIWLATARRQRETEGSGSKGIESYNEKGCYDCKGYNVLCEEYLNYRELKIYMNHVKGV